MTESQLLDLWKHSLETVVMVAGPCLVAALTVGLTVAVFQAATQLQETVLSFAPKLVALGLILATCGPWLLQRLGQNARTSFSAIEELSRAHR